MGTKNDGHIDTKQLALMIACESYLLKKTRSLYCTIMSRKVTLRRAQDAGALGARLGLKNWTWTKLAAFLGTRQTRSMESIDRTECKRKGDEKNSRKRTDGPGETLNVRWANRGLANAAH